MKKTKSFTLIEILVATTLFTFAVLGAFTIFSTTNSFYGKTTATRTTTEEARFFMETVTRKIRLADEVSVLKNQSGYPEVNIGETGDILKIKKGDEEKWYRKDGQEIILIVNKNIAEPHDVTTSGVTVSDLVLKRLSKQGIDIKITVQEKNARRVSEKSIITLKSKAYKRRYSQ